LPAKLDHHLSFQRLVKHGKGYHRVPFDHKELAHKPDLKYVSLSIFTANLTADARDLDHIYLMGCLQNAVMKDLLYTDWEMIIYTDASSWLTFPDLYEKYFLPILHHYPHVHVVEVDWRTHLSEPVTHKLIKAFGSKIKQHHNKNGWDLALVAAEAKIPGNLPIQFAKTVWRFFPGGYNLAFISRDADARISIREEIAMHEWIHSTYTFCRVFDNTAHSNPFLAGMWGAKSQCHNVLRDYHVYGSCQLGDVPLPDIIPRVEQFLADRDTMLRGYGVDELFLGEVDDRISQDYYENVITYGKGGYYSGSMVFSFFTDRQSLKVGQRMMTMMPPGGPDNVLGDHQSSRNFLEEKGVPLLGRDCYFVGEDLPLKASVSPEMIDWLIFWSLNYRSARASDMSPDKLKKQFKKFKIQENPKHFAVSVRDLSVAEFQVVYGFDKRILPHFWYCFLSGTNENIPFFEVYGTFNTNDYEMRVFESGNRAAFLAHPKLQPVLLKVVNTEAFGELSDRVQRTLETGRGRIIQDKVNLSPFFKTLRAFVLYHSRVMKYLTDDEKNSYWSEMLNVYPFSSLRQLSLAF